MVEKARSVLGALILQHVITLRGRLTHRDKDAGLEWGACGPRLKDVHKMSDISRRFSK